MLLPLLMQVNMFTPAAPPIGTRTGGLSRMVLPSKAAGDTVRVKFDFLSKLTAGNYLTSVTFNITIYTGDEIVPTLSTVGSPTLTTHSASQLFTGGNLSCVYLIECVATTNLDSHPYLVAYQAVR
jgi:hypothetical protein